jgi:hypothetical protein
LHDAVPSELPQPKLKSGFRLVGLAVRWRVALEMSPLTAQAFTTHSAVWPWWMLACKLSRLTHRVGNAVE